MHTYFWISEQIIESVIAWKSITFSKNKKKFQSCFARQKEINLLCSSELVCMCLIHFSCDKITNNSRASQKRAQLCFSLVCLPNIWRNRYASISINTRIYECLPRMPLWLMFSFLFTHVSGSQFSQFTPLLWWFTGPWTLHCTEVSL